MLGVLSYTLALGLVDTHLSATGMTIKVITTSIGVGAVILTAISC